MSVLAILALVAPGCSSESGPAIDIDLQATSGLPLDSGVPMSCKVERNDFLEFLRIEEGLQTNAKELPGIAKCVRNQLGLIDATSSPLAFVRVVAGGQPVGLAQSFDVGSVRHITLVTDEERLNTSNFPVGGPATPAGFGQDVIIPVSIFLSGGRQRVEGAIDALINAFYQSDLKSRISFGFEKAIDVVTPNETDPFFTGMVIRTEAEAECATEGIPSSGTANLVKPFCQCEATAGPGEVTYPPEPFWELRDTFKVGYRLKLAKQAQRVCDTVVVSTFYQSNGRTQESRCEAAAEGLVPHAREAMERDLGVVFEGWLGAPAEPSLHPEYERIKRATVDEAITRCPAVLPGVTMPDRSPNGERFCFDNPAGTVIKNWQRYRRYVQVGAARGAE